MSQDVLDQMQPVLHLVGLTLPEHHGIISWSLCNMGGNMQCSCCPAIAAFQVVGAKTVCEPLPDIMRG